jgi:hypothetical protein
LTDDLNHILAEIDTTLSRMEEYVNQLRVIGKPTSPPVNAGLLEAVKAFIDSEPANKYPDDWCVKLSCIQTGEVFNHLSVSDFRRLSTAIAAAQAAQAAVGEPTLNSRDLINGNVAAPLPAPGASWTEEQIEVAARAIAAEDGCGEPLGSFANGSPMRTSAWDDFMPVQRDAWRRMARAALTSLNAAPAAGHVEPSREAIGHAIAKHMGAEPFLDAKGKGNLDYAIDEIRALYKAHVGAGAGWKLVPREPDNAMREAWHNTHTKDPFDEWRNMWDAAPGSDEPLQGEPGTARAIGEVPHPSTSTTDHHGIATSVGPTGEVL